MHSGTWKIVNGTNKLGTMNAEQKATWEDQDERALASIMLIVKNSQLNLIKSCMGTLGRNVQAERTTPKSVSVQTLAKPCNAGRWKCEQPHQCVYGA